MLTISVQADDVASEKAVFIVDDCGIVGCLPVKAETEPKPYSGVPIYKKRRLIAWEEK